ncbi:MAG: YicC family protein [Lachnospiraceae bacterium]|nr:YicC family protein [Lachnospiraceae bacterium]
MIKSMTGFGRSEGTFDGRKYTVELKSVNHRYLDVNLKMPKILNLFESSIRTELKKYMERGKVDVFITFEDQNEETGTLRYNSRLAGEYLKYLKMMSEEFGLENDIRVSSLSRYPDVFVTEDKGLDEDKLWKELQQVIDGAAESFVKTRIAEGERLKSDLIAKLDGMLEVVDFITERSPAIIEQYQQKLREKVQVLLGDKEVDEARLLTEVTIFADKVCIDEELVRLKSHIKATEETLSEGGSVGRKLDFIAQEMNRESNTILSKTTDLEVSNRAITLKTEIEKVREQIQNIE